MTERELRRALRERPVPGEREAAERTLRVLRAAHAGGRSAPPPRRRALLRPALALRSRWRRSAPCSARRAPMCAAGSATGSIRSPRRRCRACPPAAGSS